MINVHERSNIRSKVHYTFNTSGLCCKCCTFCYPTLNSNICWDFYTQYFVQTKGNAMQSTDIHPYKLFTMYSNKFIVTYPCQDMHKWGKHCTLSFVSAHVPCDCKCTLKMRTRLCKSNFKLEFFYTFLVDDVVCFILCDLWGDRWKCLESKYEKCLKNLSY